MNDATLFEDLGISLLLGLLVGLQRERAGKDIGGLRTFPLITIFGTLCGMLEQHFGLHGLALGAGLLAVVVALVVGNVHLLKQGQGHGGVTTEIAALVMFIVGAFLVLVSRVAAVAVGAGVAVLLQFKPELHGIAKKLGDEDLRAIMRFALITFIILPVIPDQTYGPYNVINPFQVWLMVVLIVGISLGGYIVYKFLGANAGIIFGGVLGGVISSTATTLGYSRRVRQHPGSEQTAALVILIASTVVYFRVLLEISIVSPKLLTIAWLPIAVMALASAVPAASYWFRRRGQSESMLEHGNPTELRTAIVFALTYALVLLALAAVKEHLGGEALYPVAALSGLSDMDAITLSTARLVEHGAQDGGAGISPDLGWRLIVTATMANLFLKTLIARVAGSQALFLRMLGLLALPFAAGAALLVLWK